MKMLESEMTKIVQLITLHVHLEISSQKPMIHIGHTHIFVVQQVAMQFQGLGTKDSM